MIAMDDLGPRWICVEINRVINFRKYFSHDVRSTSEFAQFWRFSERNIMIFQKDFCPTRSGLASLYLFLYHRER